MVEVQIAYQGNLRCQARHMESGNTMVTDAPKDNHGKGESFSPTDLVGTALGTCMLTIMGIQAERMGVDLGGTTVIVQKEMIADPLRRIGKLAVQFNIPAKLGAEDRQKLENAARTCPVHKSLSPAVQVPITFNWG